MKAVLALSLLLFAQSQNMPKSSELRAALRDKDAQVRVHAIKRIEPHDLKQDAELVAILLELLQDADIEVRRLAADATKHCDMKDQKIAKSAVPALLLCVVEDKEFKVRALALARLAGFGSLAQDATKPLIKLSEDKESAIRSGLCQALMEIAPKDKEVIVTVIGRLKDSQVPVRAAAAGALRKATGLGIHNELTIPALTKALKDESWGVRVTVARALEDAGAAAAPALNTLRSIQEEAWNRTNRREIEQAIKAIEKASKTQNQSR
jgi:HEAT repeat protein